jgi:NAD(P)-dependent dehydrogenase (short-subunit alcohol dehydrogenase family)
MTDEQKVLTIAAVPLGRIGTPDDLGKAAVFLAFDDSTDITGIELFRRWRCGSDLTIGGRKTTLK